MTTSQRSSYWQVPRDLLRRSHHRSLLRFSTSAGNLTFDTKYLILTHCSNRIFGRSDDAL